MKTKELEGKEFKVIKCVASIYGDDYIGEIIIKDKEDNIYSLSCTYEDSTLDLELLSEEEYTNRKES